jgi:hypothetical protein
MPWSTPLRSHAFFSTSSPTNSGSDNHEERRREQEAVNPLARVSITTGLREGLAESCGSERFTDGAVQHHSRSGPRGSESSGLPLPAHPHAPAYLSMSAQPPCVVPEQEMTLPPTLDSAACPKQSAAGGGTQEEESVRRQC